MPAASPWPTIHAERAALARDLAPVPEAAWSTPSLCEGWTVQELLGHMTATATKTPARFFSGLARARFRFSEMSRRDAEEEAKGTPAEDLERFRAHISDTTAPPGPVDSWLGETIVHSTDIRWPLRLEHEFPAEALIRVADFYRRSNLLIGAKRRVAGVRLTATDASWTVGEGPEVSGPLLALVMAMTGRAQALTRLSGPGTEVLAARCSGT